MKDIYDFDWNHLGDLSIGRPNLGNETSVLIYRLMQYTFKDVFSKEIEGNLVHEVLLKQQPDGTLYKPGDNPLFVAIKSGNDYTDDNSNFTCKSGSLIPVSITCRTIIKNHALDGAVIAFRDITEQKKHLRSLENLNMLLKNQATTDALTGIYNRVKFNKSLTIEIKRVERYKAPLSLIIFDIDRFKLVNDTYGHLAGDKVLKRLAKLISANIRNIDIFARWGGEEFVIQIPGTSPDDAIKLAEKLRSKIETYDFLKPKKITASFGVATFLSGDNNITLISRADEALYRAKECGRNQVASS